jgi:choline-sulfatase/uncharacterized sulfatase
MPTSDGKDISHLLFGERGEVHRFGITELPWSRSIRKGRYRYVYYPDEMFAAEYPQGFGELYDLENDPWEMTNLYFEKSYGGLIDEFKKELLEFLITTTRVRTINPDPQIKGINAVERYHRTMEQDMKVGPGYVRDMTFKNYI